MLEIDDDSMTDRCILNHAGDGGRGCYGGWVNRDVSDDAYVAHGIVG